MTPSPLHQHLQSLPGEFDEKFPEFLENHSASYLNTERAVVKSFITARDRRTIEIVLGMIERKKRSDAWVGLAPGDNAVGSEHRAFGFNQAVNEIFSDLRGALEGNT